MYSSEDDGKKTEGKEFMRQRFDVRQYLDTSAVCKKRKRNRRHRQIESDQEPSDSEAESSARSNDRLRVEGLYGESDSSEPNK